MSITRHHAEWLALLDISGPFLSLPVLMRVFPQGLDAPDAAVARELRLAYDEWLDNAQGLTPDPALHRVWVEWVLRRVLELPDQVLRVAPARDGDAAWPSVQVAEYSETLRPDLMVVEPDAGGKPRLLVVIVPAGQSLEKAPPRATWQASHATRMMTLLRGAGVRLGLLTNGEQWMLVDRPADENVTTGFSSWYARLWLDEPLTLQAFRTLLGARRFFGVPDEQTIEKLLDESVTNQQDVTDQLGYQVRRAVELLVQALDLADQNAGRGLLADVPEERLYEAALAVMMRLVFLLFAEEQHLLLLGDDIYDRHYAASTLLNTLREAADKSGEEVLERHYDAWARLLAIFRAVYGGFEHDRLTMPAYGGSLFDPDRYPFLEGRAEGTSWLETPADPPAVSNRVVLHLLEALQILRVKIRDGSPAEARRLSFRALDIEQIGHVYEGLLDHTAKRASEPVLGLAGTREQEPELPLALLEREAQKGEAAFLAFLKEQTGRTPSALKKAYTAQLDAFRATLLRAACGNDATLFARVEPFAGLIRDDDYGRPVVIPVGSVYVTTGTERRATGTHYTPRSLTEPIVQYTLEPLVYHGPAEGLPREEWRLHSAAELLRLRVCDMAMGSGAFLVQACRYLSERLLEAWALAEGAGDGATRLITREGLPTDNPDQAIPADPADRLVVARRLVADRCLYGVDKNPLAVEMAKLSLWLITLAKGQPFSFLDHALRCGDSLLGIADIDQLQHWSLAREAGPTTATFLTAPLQRALEHALNLRQRIRELPVRDVRDAARKAAWLREAEAALGLVRLAADLLVATALHKDKKRRAELSDEFLERMSLAAEAWETLGRGGVGAPSGDANRQALAALRREADDLLQGRKLFHWPLEFPEVFVEEPHAPPEVALDLLTLMAEFEKPPEPFAPGFSAIVGNPPFQGGKLITGGLGVPYRDYLVNYLANGTRGHADLCAYFFLHAGDILQRNGHLGFIATNTISQGDTREVGLDQLVQRGFSIPRAVRSRPWPGLAAVEVSHIWLRQGKWQNIAVLDDKLVVGISPFLTVLGDTQDKPYRLLSNTNKSFNGSYILGMGFVLTPEEANVLIQKDYRNREALFPYINGEDLNSRYDQSPSRWVINFHDWSLEQAEDYPDLMDIVRNKVKPERQRLDKLGNYVLRKPLPDKWWTYADKRPNLYNVIRKNRRVLVLAQVSRTVAFAFLPNGWIYSHKITVFGFESADYFALLQSTFHRDWAWKYSSTMKSDLSYSPSDCFETFPFPACILDDATKSTELRAILDSIGEAYHEHRRQIMLTRQEGLTKTYNRFHDPREASADIAELHRLHVEMDNAVAAAYGWDDLDLGHGFHETKQGLRYTISESARRTVLDRLLALNHERYAEEVAQGLHDKKGASARGQGASKRGRPKASDEQASLFEDA